jgi:hypothetical protein
VRSEKWIFTSDPSLLRRRFSNGGADAILIAPFLGRREKRGDGEFSLGSLGDGGGGKRYLDRVLADLKEPLGLSKTPNLNKLVVACHSGGGALMRQLMGTLGDYESKLIACWGFDCLYSDGDAAWWYN